MTYSSRRIATLDLGTNTLLLLVAERNDEGIITVLADENETPRLGEGLRQHGQISPKVLTRVSEAVIAFVKKARSMGAEEIFLTGTSAAREAKNQEELVSRLRNDTGIDIEILAANEEARLTFLSATMERGGEDPTMVVDIGGGSTEITWGVGPRFDGGRSLNLGTVKLLEGFLTSDPPNEDQIKAAQKEIDLQLARITPLGSLAHYLGTAGSFTHLASLDLQLPRYHSERVTGHNLNPQKTRVWSHRLQKMSMGERLQLPGIDPRRADVLLSGTMIIDRLFEKFGAPQFTVVDRGIRFGKLFKELRRFAPPIRFLKEDPISESAERVRSPQQL